MASHQTKAQKQTVERVMHEFKEGELRTGGDGAKVKSHKQAVAIALSEAGASNQQSEPENRHHLNRSKAKERKGDTAQADKEGKLAQDRTLHKATAGSSGKTKAALYQEARQQDIAGRSKMSKAQLERALAH